MNKLGIGPFCAESQWLKMLKAWLFELLDCRSVS